MGCRAMSPRAEFIGLSLLVATTVQIGVVVLLAADRHAGIRDVAFALRMTPAALLAAGVGTWLVTRWHARAIARGTQWKAGGMTLRALLTVFLLFPIALGIWVVVSAGIDAMVAAAPGSMRESLTWWPLIVLYGALAAVMFGAVPGFILEYFACRRYLRRQAVLSTDHA